MGFLVECELGCWQENRGFHPCLACLLNILKAKAVKRDSTIKNINVPCRFSFSFISGVRTGFGILNSSHSYTKSFWDKNCSFSCFVRFTFIISPFTLCFFALSIFLLSILNEKNYIDRYFFSISSYLLASYLLLCLMEIINFRRKLKRCESEMCLHHKLFRNRKLFKV